MRVLLYGLPIVGGRTVGYGKVDRPAARELFIRRALVEREWDTRHDFFAENGRQLEAVEALEQRARRRDLLVSDQVVFDFFDSRIPEDVTSGAHFDRWWKHERRTRPDLLTYTPELLVEPAAAAELDPAARPDAWKQGELTLPLSYRFEPGRDADGVTVHIPVKAIAQVRPDGFDWLVPALRRELITALIRGLPKELRRRLVPVPEVVEQVLGGLQPRRGALVDQVSQLLERLRGVRVPREAWAAERLPAHLRMTFRVEDVDGTVIAEGLDLDAVREQARPRLRAALAAATASLERSGLRDWPGGALPEAVALPGTGKSVRAYPALVDEGVSVAVRVLDTPEAAVEAMRAGTRRLLLLTVPSPLREVRARLGRAEQLALAVAPHGSVDAVLEDGLVAAVDALVAQAGGPARDDAAWTALRAKVAASLADMTLRAVRGAAAILDAERDVRRRMEALTAEPLQPAVRDVERQVRRLVHPGFVTEVGVARLPDVERYLRGAERRLERLAQTLAGDRDRMGAVHELEAEYERRLEAWPPGRPLPKPLRDVRWLLEELRMSHFAQGLGTRGQVSSKRIRKLLDEARP